MRKPSAGSRYPHSFATCTRPAYTLHCADHHDLVLERRAEPHLDACCCGACRGVQGSLTFAGPTQPKKYLLQDLTVDFPDSDWISATAAQAQYNLRNFDEAQELYEDLLESDPYRIDVRLLYLTPSFHWMHCVPLTWL